MKWLRNLNTGTKIISLVILMALFLAGVGFSGYYFSKESNTNSNSMYTNKLLPISYIKEARADNRNVQGIMYRLLLAPLTPSEELELKSKMNKLIEEYNQEITNYKSTSLDAYEVEQLAEFTEELQIYRAERDKALEMASNGDKLGGYNYLLDKATVHMDEADSILVQLSDYNDKTAQELMEESNRNFATSVKIALAISFVAIVLALGIGTVVSRLISVPLKKAVKNITEIAEGNLAIDNLKIDSKDEIGELAKAMDMMSNNLKELIGKVAQTSEQVASSAEELNASAEQNSQAATQVASAITDVAAGTEKQSSAIDETSATIEQMSASIQQMAATTTTVAEHTDTTASMTLAGQQAVDNAVKQMDAVGKGSAKVQESILKLSSSSQQIGEITSVISGIAGQTNLLALNAAIEAARAGEQGRGFAVVAEEVRKLAEQSAEAATKITTLINENQANINDAVRAMEGGANDIQLGIEVVHKAGDAFVEIASSVDQVSNQVQEISVTTHQMASSSQQVVASVREIETISRVNLGQTQTVSAATEEQTASIEQIASASESLAFMAQELQLAVSKFRF